MTPTEAAPVSETSVYPRSTAVDDSYSGYSAQSQQNIDVAPTMAPYSIANPDEKSSSVNSALRQRINDYETKTTASTAPPVQKVGDTWVAASVVGRNSGSEADLRSSTEPDALRDSVQRMFDKGPDVRIPSRSDSEMTARIKAWQPATERELSIFSRTGSKRSQASVGPLSVDQHIPVPSQVYTDTKADTVLSFDPNDLNPSRSASQVRRASTILGGSGGEQVTARRRGAPSTVIEERSDDGLTEAMRAATHISHITFPKPTVTTALNIPHRLLTPIPSASETSTESGETTAMVTPQTSRSVVSVHTLEGSVLDKLDSHSSEHGDIAKQVDGVQAGLLNANAALSTILAQTKVLSDPMQAPVPRALEDRISSLGLDVKGLDNAIQLSNLAANRRATEEPKLPEIHAKLETIARACEDILAMQKQMTAVVPVPVPDISTADAESVTLADMPVKASPRPLPAAKAPATPNIKPITPAQPQKRNSLNVTTDPKDEKEAGEEVAQIMAQLTGGSNKSPRLVDLQVLHNSSVPSTPQVKSEPMKEVQPVDHSKSIEALVQQIAQLSAQVKEMQDERASQTKQNSDILQCESWCFMLIRPQLMTSPDLTDNNKWQEKNAESQSKGMAELTERLKPFTGEPATETSEAIPGMPVLMTDVHSMMLEQKETGARVDNLIHVMADGRAGEYPPFLLDAETVY